MEALENGAAAAAPKALASDERVFEFMLNALRLTEGFPAALFEERTGLSAEVLEERIVKLRKK